MIRLRVRIRTFERSKARYCARVAPIHFRPAMTNIKLNAIKTTSIAAEELKCPPTKDS